MDSVCSDGGLLRRVSPFRHLRINGYLLLPEAFRSLSRLSSALSAKASTIRSFMHDQLALKAGGGFSPLYSSKTHTYIALYALVFGQFFALFSSKCVIITNHYTVSCYNNYLGCLDQDILIFRFLYAVFKVHGLIITTVSPRAQNKVFRSRIFSEYPSASLQTSMLKQAWQGCLQAASAALIIIKWRIRDSNS